MDIQNLLTYIADTVLLGAIALYSALFLDGLLNRPRPVSLVESEQQERLTFQKAPFEQQHCSDTIVPFARPVRKPAPAEKGIADRYALDDVGLITWAKQHKDCFPDLKKAIGKWSYTRKLSAREREMIQDAMTQAKTA